MKTPLTVIGLAIATVTACTAPASPDPAKLRFDREPLALPPLSLAEEMKRPVTAPSLTFTSNRPIPSPPSRGIPPTLPKPNRVRLPLVEPNPDIDYKMVVVPPDPNTEFKMTVIVPASPADADAPSAKR